MERRSLTIGVLAERLHVPIHRVEYLVRSRDIQPKERAGHLRVFDEKAVETLRQEIQAGNQRRGLVDA